MFAQNYLSQLVPQVYKKLETQGYFETEDPDMKGKLDSHATLHF